MDFAHVPVLLDEVVQALRLKPGGRYIDGTVGGGGHARRILELTSPGGRLLGVDRDPRALAAAGETLGEFGARVDLRHGNFSEIDRLARSAGYFPADGVLLDLGVSSPQLDEAERGFSYQQDAPLDMRMDPGSGPRARDLVNGLPEAELARVIGEYGEERWASRIAAFIARRRDEAPIETTGELVEVIKAAIPAGARRSGPHPARRTFQALRIATNDELGALRQGLRGAVAALAPGGRVAVISFHSLEDRIVKQSFAALARGCTCPPEAPVCTCGQRPSLRLVGRKPVLASAREAERNPRARSAKLRAAERLESGDGGSITGEEGE